MEKETSSTQEVEIPLAKRERKHSEERVEVDMKNGLSTHEVSLINRLSQYLQIALNSLNIKRNWLDGVFVTIFRFFLMIKDLCLAIFTLLAMLHYEKCF